MALTPAAAADITPKSACALRVHSDSGGGMCSWGEATGGEATTATCAICWCCMSAAGMVGPSLRLRNRDAGLMTVGRCCAMAAWLSCCWWWACTACVNCSAGTVALRA